MNPKKTDIRPRIPAAANMPGLITWHPALGFLQSVRWPDSTPIPIIRSTSAIAKQSLHNLNYLLNKFPFFLMFFAKGWMYLNLVIRLAISFFQIIIENNKVLHNTEIFIICLCLQVAALLHHPKRDSRLGLLQ